MPQHIHKTPFYKHKKENKMIQGEDAEEKSLVGPGETGTSHDVTRLVLG
jgi:hypothetical protein